MLKRRKPATFKPSPAEAAAIAAHREFMIRRYSNLAR